ncbi:MAG: type II toxin-antitoxin system Phd/YefM family antitoxin [Betaproteobacteria bacterium]|nr:type II toxin-antitoxin system Phd/YefM family antitoxin [Betaproteobacteria bacterium]
MKTMTSLEAQNRFGELIDTSQREPVLITRRGRPVSIVISPGGDTRSAFLHFMKVVRELSPLSGKAAAEAVHEFAVNTGNQAAQDGLTEDKITALVHANR